MAQFKLVISDSVTGKSEALDLKDAGAQQLLGRKIGETIDGGAIGSTGKITITGGSDRAGFPMRSDVQGGGKNYILLTRGVGLKSDTGGVKKRKLVRGNTVTEEIYQVNALRASDGPKPVPKPA